MKKTYFILILFFLSLMTAKAQDSLKTQDLGKLPMSYYQSLNTLERQYDMEMFKKQQRLRMLGNEIQLIGYATAIGVIIGGPLLFPDCSLWILIPSETIIAGGIMVGSFMWAYNLKQKAEAIKESTISLLDINSNSSLYLAQYSAENTHILGYGIGYKIRF